MAPRKIQVETLVDCPFSVADEYLEGYLERAESGGPEAEIRVPVPLGPAPRRRVLMEHGIRSDSREPGRSHDEIALRWSARNPLLPDFHGTVSFRIAGGRTRMILEGEYVAPGGRLGALFDAVVGRHIARATLRDLARRLAEELARRETDWWAKQGYRTATN